MKFLLLKEEGQALFANEFSRSEKGGERRQARRRQTSSTLLKPGFLNSNGPGENGPESWI